jgi:hypothetical protein
MRLPENASGAQHEIHPCGTSHVWPSLTNSATRDDLFLSYLVIQLDGPIGVICRNLIAPTSQADSLQQIARKQCFRALATTLYGLGHAQESLLYDGRGLYLRALKMVNTSITAFGSTGITETLSSVVALSLHEV